MKTLIKAMNTVIRTAKLTDAEKLKRSTASGRALAESIQFDDISIKAGTILKAGEIALLTEAGVETASVRRLPNVDCVFVDGPQRDSLSDALKVVCLDSAQAVEVIGENASIDSAVDAALESKSDVVVLFGGDRLNLISELKNRKCRILFDETDTEPCSNAVAAQVKENGRLILCFPSDPLLDGVLALELFLRPVMRSMLCGFEKVGGYLRAELRCKGAIEPIEDKIRLVPAKLTYFSGAPQVTPVAAEGFASLNGVRALIVVLPDAVPYDHYSIVEVIPLPFDDRFLV